MSKMFYMWCRWNVRKVWVFISVSSDALQADVQTNSGHKMLRTHPGAPRVFWRQNKTGRRKTQERKSNMGATDVRIVCFSGFLKMYGCLWIYDTPQVVCLGKGNFAFKQLFSHCTHMCVGANLKAWGSGGREGSQRQEFQRLFTFVVRDGSVYQRARFSGVKVELASN